MGVVGNDVGKTVTKYNSDYAKKLIPMSPVKPKLVPTNNNGVYEANSRCMGNVFYQNADAPDAEQCFALCDAYPG
jgi:hypothetical protein